VARRLVAALAAILAVLAVVIAVPRTARAGTGLRYQVVDADNAHDGGVYYRNSPHWTDTQRTTGVGGYYGETVELVCGAWGDAVGPYANRRWHLVDNISRPSAGRGWLPDRYLNTPNVANQATPGEPECGSRPVTANASYNRTAAIRWALAHAQDPQANGTLCTWFVSNALWVGGMPKTAGWQPGTYSSTWVEGLADYLRAHASVSWMDITSNLATNAVPDAVPGDIIVYDWNDGGTTYDHMSFVVDIASGQYPEVAEWGQFDFTRHPWYRVTHPRSPYVKRGWTWSAMNNKWLQDGHRGMRAYLLHINGGYFTPTY
jgi:hypothetical protein